MHHLRPVIPVYSTVTAVRCSGFGVVDNQVGLQEMRYRIFGLDNA
jgi:hypothetical protein